MYYSTVELNILYYRNYYITASLWLPYTKRYASGTIFVSQHFLCFRSEIKDQVSLVIPFNTIQVDFLHTFTQTQCTRVSIHKLDSRKGERRTKRPLWKQTDRHYANQHIQFCQNSNERHCHHQNNWPFGHHWALQCNAVAGETSNEASRTTYARLSGSVLSEHEGGTKEKGYIYINANP